MEELQLLTHFIQKVASDNRLKPVHISLSLALCHYWIRYRFQRHYRISRKTLMMASRISSKATYHKTIKELQRFGYLKYSPSYHPVKASEVELLNNPIHDPK